jgi:hypothetical protein
MAANQFVQYLRELQELFGDQGPSGGILDAVHANPRGQGMSGQAMWGGEDAALGRAELRTYTPSPTENLEATVRGDYRDPIRSRIADAVSYPLNALSYAAENAPGLAYEMTGIPGVQRGTQRVMNNSGDTGSSLEMAKGVGEVALGTLPAVGVAGKSAGPVYNALFGSPSRTMTSVMAPTALVASADAAKAGQQARDRRSQYIEQDPEVARIRQEVQAAENAAKIAGGGGLSPADEARLGQIKTQMDQITNQLLAATERRESKRPKSGAPDRKRDPVFFGAEDEITKLEAQRTRLETDLREVQARSVPNPTKVTESNAALARHRSDLDRASQAAEAGYRNTAPTKELYPEAVSYAQSAALAIPALIGARVGQGERLTRNAAASSLDEASSALTSKTPETVRNALAARSEYDAIAAKDSGTVWDTIKGVGSLAIPTSARDAQIAGVATIPFAAPTVLDISRPKDTRAYEEAYKEVTDPTWYAGKAAVLAAANAANKGGQAIGGIGPRTNPDLAPTTALRNEYGIGTQRDGLGVDMGRVGQATANADAQMFSAQEQAAIAAARLRAAERATFATPKQLPLYPQGGGAFPPGGNPGPPGGGGPVGGQGQLPVLPQGPSQNPVRGTRIVYEAPQQSVARPYIASEVGAGRDVPTLGSIEQTLSAANINRTLPANFNERLKNAQGIVDGMRSQGIPDSQIAQALAQMMASGAIRGLPAAAGAVALDPSLVGIMPPEQRPLNALSY